MHFFQLSLDCYKNWNLADLLNGHFLALNNIFFLYILLFFVFDLQKKIFSVHVHTDGFFFSFFFRKILISLATIFYFLVFFLREDFDTFDKPLFEAFLIFQLTFLYTWQKCLIGFLIHCKTLISRFYAIYTTYEAMIYIKIS